MEGKEYTTGGGGLGRGTAWSEDEKEVLVEITKQTSSPDEIVKTLVATTGVERTPAAVHTMLRMIEREKPMTINGEVLREFSKAHASYKATLTTAASSRRIRWMSGQKAAEYVDRSDSWIAQKGREGVIARREAVDGTFEYDAADLEQFRPKEVSQAAKEEEDLAKRIKMISDGRSNTAVPVRPPNMIRMRKKPWSAFLVVENITPERAAELLNSSKGNRPISMRTVAKYTQQILAGEWRENSTCISVDWNGNEINGHHRCYAIIASGKTVTSYVMYGVAPESYLSEDDVNARKAWENLNDPFRRDIAAWATTARRAFRNSAVPFTLSELMRYTEAHADAIEWAKGHSGRRTLFTLGYVSSAFVFAYYLNPAKVEEFAKQIESRENLSAGMPAYALVEYLNGSRSGTTPTKDGRVKATRKVLRALLAHINGEKLHQTHLYEQTDFTKVLKAQPKNSVLLEGWEP